MGNTNEARRIWCNTKKSQKETLNETKHLEIAVNRCGSGGRDRFSSARSGRVVFSPEPQTSKLIRRALFVYWVISVQLRSYFTFSRNTLTKTATKLLSSTALDQCRFIHQRLPPSTPANLFFTCGYFLLAVMFHCARVIKVNENITCRKLNAIEVSQSPRTQEELGYKDFEIIYCWSFV